MRSPGPRSIQAQASQAHCDHRVLSGSHGDGPRRIDFTIQSRPDFYAAGGPLIGRLCLRQTGKPGLGPKIRETPRPQTRPWVANCSRRPMHIGPKQNPMSTAHLVRFVWPKPCFSPGLGRICAQASLNLNGSRAWSWWWLVGTVWWKCRGGHREGLVTGPDPRCIGSGRWPCALAGHTRCPASPAGLGLNGSLGTGGGY